MFLNNFSIKKNLNYVMAIVHIIILCDRQLIKTYQDFQPMTIV